ncbi:MAG TPA: LTA synthase family protein [Salinivirgaceae bacterium]|nr:LTA synthase family protein [Salinivirgaceae bacterium]HQA76298.1 LTA synthase family protein [Salinivirgaceae bacterium]
MSVFEKISSLFRYIVKIFVGILSVSILLRTTELIYKVYITPSSENALKLELMGYLTDFAAISRVLLIILLLGFIFIWSKLTYKIIIQIFSNIYVLISLSSVSFFIVSFVPLDHAVFTYSLTEIVETIKASRLGLGGVLMVVIPFALFHFITSKIKMSKLFSYIVIALCLFGSFALYPIMNNYNRKQTSYVDKTILLNKADYFIYKSFDYFKSEYSNIDNKFDIMDLSAFINYRDEDGFYKKANRNEGILKGFDKGSSSIKYPLNHVNTFNPLKNYFKEFDEKPNIIIIIVESLNHIFFNREKISFCFIPFLDSLKNESLYWNRCFSTSSRTFGVLPSMLGSLPYGKVSFAMLKTIPNHYSIPNILNKNGYYSAFFYGGWLNFQGMESFMEKQEIQYLRLTFPEDCKKMDADGNGTCWGYHDSDVFKRSFEVIDSINKKPMLNIYLTLSTHHPFSVPNKEKYKQQFDSITKKSSTVNNKVLKNPKPYISVLYADDCLRNLFNEYKKRENFKNTIFVITGDHAMHEIGTEGEVDMYHVPLIIYSPMLKENQTFNAVVSHLDIAPSLLNLLSDSKLIRTPEVVHWLDYGLETNNEINYKFIPFIENNKDIVSCIYSTYYFNDGALYELLSNGEIKPITDSDLSNKIELKLNNFRRINQYVTSEHKLVPPHVYYGGF